MSVFYQALNWLFVPIVAVLNQLEWLRWKWWWFWAGTEVLKWVAVVWFVAWVTTHLQRLGWV